MAEKTKAVAVARTPLAGCAAIKRPHLQQEELPPCGKFILRGKGDDEAFCSAVQGVLKAAPPQTPNSTAAAADGALLLWLGPEEWLLWTAEKNRAQTAAALREALAPLHAAVVDVSDYYTLFRLSGDKVQEALACGCPLDVREANFADGACAQSHFRNAAVLLVRRGKAVEVQVRWSFARYLWDYLDECGRLLAD